MNKIQKLGPFLSLFVVGALAAALAPASLAAADPLLVPASRDRYDGKLEPVLRGGAEHSVARQWNDALLDAIRIDSARPTVHSRNLFHLSAAMWDAWAAYDYVAEPLFSLERGVIPEAPKPEEIQALREEAISYAAYRLLSARFAASPNAEESLQIFDSLMDALGYDRSNASTVGKTPAALGNRIAIRILAMGLAEGANEEDDYEIANGYEPVNPPLPIDVPGNPDMPFPNRWQPLALELFIDQSGIDLGEFPGFLCPHWGVITKFMLTDEDRDPVTTVFMDPGSPPYLGGVGDAEFKANNVQVIEFSSWLTPDDGVMIDVGPGARGNNTLGTNDGNGRPLNPVTSQPYAPNVVLRGDYGVLGRNGRYCTLRFRF